jgi:predicted amidophosphoribosyltransferase
MKRTEVIEIYMQEYKEPYIVRILDEKCRILKEVKIYPKKGVCTSCGKKLRKDQDTWCSGECQKTSEETLL